uniref:Putative secreted protein n=1 Tax=Xenopsylla cheopis TaxID=163159 RepID=A0A6M2E269_XENCH
MGIEDIFVYTMLCILNVMELLVARECNACQGHFVEAILTLTLKLEPHFWVLILKPQMDHPVMMTCQKDTTIMIEEKCFWKKIY